jgi:timeless
VVVQKKVRSKSKSKTKKKNASRVDKSLGHSTAHKCVDFDEISGEVSTLLQENGDIPSDVVPFDAASATKVISKTIFIITLRSFKSLALARADPMKKIKKCLNEFNAREAIAVLRASRELWPEGEVSGSPEVRSEEELLILREIFLADQPSEFAGLRKSFIYFI